MQDEHEERIRRLITASEADIGFDRDDQSSILPRWVPNTRPTRLRDKMAGAFLAAKTNAGSFLSERKF